MKRTRGQFIGILVGLLLSAGCGHVIYADGPYHGRVIDKETKQPIEGAAVVAVWRKESPAAHPIITFYDAQETLTDLEGNFTIPGIVGGSVNPLAKIREPLFIIFKPGYEAFGTHGGWKLPPPQKEERTVELQPLKTSDQKVDNQSKVSLFYCARRGKCPNLVKLINVERTNLGLKPIYVEKGEKQ